MLSESKICLVYQAADPARPRRLAELRRRAKRIMTKFCRFLEMYLAEPTNPALFGPET